MTTLVVKQEEVFVQEKPLVRLSLHVIEGLSEIDFRTLKDIDESAFDAALTEDALFNGRVKVKFLNC